MLNVVLPSIVYATVAVGIIEFLKNFFPETIKSKTKTFISLFVEIVVAVLGSVFFTESTALTKWAIGVASVGIAQFEYSTIVTFFKELTKLLKSIVSKQ